MLGINPNEWLVGVVGWNFLPIIFSIKPLVVLTMEI
jgi:hypothetical protein